MRWVRELLVSVLESFLVFVVELAMGKTSWFWKQFFGSSLPPGIFITFIRTFKIYNTKKNSLIPIQTPFPELHGNFIKHLWKRWFYRTELSVVSRFSWCKAVEPWSYGMCGRWLIMPRRSLCPTKEPKVLQDWACRILPLLQRCYFDTRNPQTRLTGCGQPWLDIGCLALHLHLFPQLTSFLWPVFISLLIQACLMLAWGIFVWCR